MKCGKKKKKKKKKNTSETEIVYLIEFKALVIHILTELGEKIDELNENFKKNLEKIYKKNQSEVKNNLNEKNTIMN